MWLRTPEVVRWWRDPKPEAFQRLEHFPEKWTPVFCKEMRQTLNLERFLAVASAVCWST
jgi:hypothetical protein